MAEFGGGRTARLALVLTAAASLAACASVRPEYATGVQPHRAHQPSGAGGAYKVGAPYQVAGVWYVPKEQPGYDQTGTASWYGDEFHMKATANGEIFDMNAPSAAHTTLPLPCLVEVTNLDNGRKLVVRVNDRGPFVGGRIIDLSHEAARELGYDRAGLAHVRVRYVGPAPLYGEDSRRYARATSPAAPIRLAAATTPPKPRAADPMAARVDELMLAEAPPPPVPPKAVRRAPEVVFTSAPLPTAAIAVSETALAPLTGAALPDLAPKPVAVAALKAASSVAPAATPPVASGFRIQAGVFSTPESAQKAVSQLAAAGPASVVPMQRNAVTLYRVVLDGAADEDAAEALREKAAEAGFADARILRPGL
ncbi:MAG: septal ring lytic transglycosylase RlpA family protein [Phenylobacterium sp.]|nr:MAG: septal ring lytic transglycosylase RlpA family protein [Phenylobacterium sp.]